VVVISVVLLFSSVLARSDPVALGKSEHRREQDWEQDWEHDQKRTR
jgi:hypothetical protein